VEEGKESGGRKGKWRKERKVEEGIDIQEGQG
jgi:hypothetical protein